MARSSDETLTHPPKEGEEQHGAKTDGGEKGNTGKDDSPVGFWHPELKKTRREVIKKWIITTLVLIIAILGVLSIYWAVLFRTDENLSSLVVWIVDFDAQTAPYTSTTPLVGPAIVSAGLAQNAPSGSVGWVNVPISQFNGDPMEVRNQVYDFKAWAAIIVNPNATAMLNEAIQNGNASYDPLGACQTIYVEARDQTTVDTYVVPLLTQFQTEVTSMFSQMWAQQTLTMAASNTTLLNNLQQVPQAISPAIGFSTFNLRPFNPPVATPAVSIGLIYLIIIAFFSFSFYLPIHMQFIQSPGHRPLKFYQLIIWRWCATIVAYFLLSFFYSVISLAFQISFSAPPASHTEVAYPATAYGRGSFPVYWMVNWVGMIALGMACENVAMLVGQPWTALWLIFWVITNVSTALYSIDLAPHFFYWGYAWPLHNIVEASRSILFDLHSRIGLNFGVLFAWCAVNTALFPFMCYFLRWKTMREKKKEAEKKE